MFNGRKINGECLTFVAVQNNAGLIFKED